MPSPPPNRLSTYNEPEESPDEYESDDDLRSLESNRSSLDREALLSGSEDEEVRVPTISDPPTRDARIDRFSASPGLSERKGYTKASPQLDIPTERPRITPLTKLYDAPDEYTRKDAGRGRDKGWRAVSFATSGPQDSNRDISPVPPYSPRRRAEDCKGEKDPYGGDREGKPYRRRESSDTYARLRPPHPRRTTSEMEAGAASEREVKHPTGGIFSQLLRLSALPQSTGQGRTPLMPTLRTLGLKRSGSDSSLFEGELDSEDPRVTGVVPRRRSGEPFLKMFAEQGQGNLDEIQMHVAGESGPSLTDQTFLLDNHSS